MTTNNQGDEAMSRFYSPGFQVIALPMRKRVWQFTLFAIGHDEDDDDHEEYLLITWYIQFLFWQFTYSWEVDNE